MVKTDKRKFFSIINPFSSILSAVMLVFVIATGFFNLWLAMGEFVIYFAALAVTNYIKVKKTDEVVQYIEKFSLKAESLTTSDSLFMDFPLPITVIRVGGEISWYNQEFWEMVDPDTELAEKHIQTYIPSVDFASVTQAEGSGILVEVGTKTYKVFSRMIKVDKKFVDQFLGVLFFIDVTQYEYIQSRYESEKPVEAIVLIDNYEELYQGTPDGYRAQVFAEVERALVDWAREMHGTIRRFERDRYLFVFQQQYLEHMIQNKFEVLDTVKKISAGNTIEPTLSIGIGYGSDTISENDKFANLSIDMALARGGDQAVIRDPMQFSFFGGRSRETERHTRVKARVTAHALEELMASSEKIYIMGHANADMDAFGSAAALYQVALSKDKYVRIVMDKVNIGIQEMYDKIKRDQRYENAFISTREALDTVNDTTLLIIVDVHKAALCEKPDLVENAQKIVVIDHHRRSAGFIDNAILVYHEPFASSTCELVTELVQYMHEDNRLTPLEAEALYAGIVMDTKSFTFKTGSRTFEAAAYLRRLGVSPLQVKNENRNDFDLYMERAKIVGKATIYKGNIAISVYEQPMSEFSYVTASAADELMNIRGIDASFVLSKGKGIVSINGRSYGKINVQVLLEYLGGGGHATIAGAQLKDVSLEEARIKLQQAIDQYDMLEEE